MRKAATRAANVCFTPAISAVRPDVYSTAESDPKRTYREMHEALHL